MVWLRNIRRRFNDFFNRSSTLNNEPLNKVSLTIIIIIDIFILANVFIGLNNIATWHLSPPQQYPCYAQWHDYQTDKKTEITEKNYRLIKNVLQEGEIENFSFTKSYQELEADHLGKVASICLNYGKLQDEINNPKNKKLIQEILAKEERIFTLKRANNKIRQEYDSTLLEKIANQPENLSINQTPAAQAKAQLEKNKQEIAQLEQEIAKLKQSLLKQPEIIKLIQLVQNEAEYQQLVKGYQKAQFWYPSIQLILQAIFLLPLIYLTWIINKLADRRGYGLVYLITWHLLIIFFIPLIIKIFEFLQIGVLFELISQLIARLFRGLVFLVSYIYILLLPLIGFAIIKFCQKVIFNPQLQAANRVQKSKCIKCAKKIKAQDSYCPHCGYYQYQECHNCHNLTYKHLPFCKVCGAEQNTVITN